MGKRIEFKSVSVIGAGSWGTAFSNYVAGLGKKVYLWVREDDVYEWIKNYGENRVFLSGIKLSKNIFPIKRIEDAVLNSDIVLIAVPSKFCRSIYEELSSYLKEHYILSLTKGMDEEGEKRLSSLMKEIFPESVHNKISILSGPSFAKEFALGHPTAVAIASEDISVAKRLQKEFSSERLRIYVTDDLAGVEIGGALKNIIAIASGIAAGMGFGYNTTASLVTRGNIEIIRFGLFFGAREETFLGLSGIGDLMLTSFGPLSRNRTFGFEIGKGRKKEEILKDMRMVVEGLTTVKTVWKISKKKGITMPITEKVYEILYEDKAPMDALKELMLRSLKIEWNIR